MKIELIDQVYQKSDGWYFNGEDDVYGPYKSRSLVVNMLRRYIRLFDKPLEEKFFD